MNDPRQAALQVLGAIDWQTDVTGYCKCPGQALHTNPNGKRDCRVHVDGAPTIFCAARLAPGSRRANRDLAPFARRH